MPQQLILYNNITATNSMMCVSMLEQQRPNTYSFRMKWEPNSMYMLNSLPWHWYPVGFRSITDDTAGGHGDIPRWAISHASRPRPAPGTNTDICEGSLNGKVVTSINTWYHTILLVGTFSWSHQWLACNRNLSLLGPEHKTVRNSSCYGNTSVLQSR